MFGLLKRNKKPALRPLVFKDNKAAFAYACKYCNCSLTDGNTLISLVEMAAKDANGKQLAFVIVATDQGGAKILGRVADSVPPLSEGDLVAFQVMDLGQGVISAVGIHGIVIAKLAAELAVDKGWRIIRHPPA